MSKYHLCELGMAALFHDIGKAEIPRAVLEKGGELSPQEQRMFENHPIYGVKKMMKFKGLDNISCRMITGIFEHHLQADFSGYPRLRYQRLSLIGRIISIADCYESLTSARRGHRSYPPDKALRFLLSRAGKNFDAGLVKLFIYSVSLHGIGSLLLLNTKELAVVVENNPARPDNPRIRIIADARGREVEGEVVELLDPATPRTVVSCLDPHATGLDVSKYFFG
jgi:HD-GYP domain-containing protein (c-di-GMP phosphodiesterase class II)